MPSEILEDTSLYEPNSIRVVRTLKSLGAQERGKYAHPQLDEWINALHNYNDRIKLIKEALDQQRKL